MLKSACLCLLSSNCRNLILEQNTCCVTEGTVVGVLAHCLSCECSRLIVEGLCSIPCVHEEMAAYCLIHTS